MGRFSMQLKDERLNDSQKLAEIRRTIEPAFKN